MSTSMTSLEIEQYHEGVRTALADLAPAARDDLLEDLAEHLADVAAEGTGSLLDRLGPPAQYAAELRTAAGLALPQTPVRAPGLGAAFQRFFFVDLAPVAGLVRRADLRGGQLLGYPRLRDVLRAARPGWWIVRGWVLAQFVAGQNDLSRGFFPSVGGNRLAGLLLVAALVAASVRVGLWCQRAGGRWRLATGLADAWILLWCVFILLSSGGSINSSGVAAYTPVDGYQTDNWSGVADMYVYDSAGNQVKGARIYDRSGSPIEVGNSPCDDGNPATTTAPDGSPLWAYPLCPANVGPFRAGPGPLPSATDSGVGAAPPSAGGSPADLPGASPAVSASSSPGDLPTDSASPSAGPSGSARPSVEPTGRATAKPTVGSSVKPTAKTSAKASVTAPRPTTPTG